MTETIGPKCRAGWFGFYVSSAGAPVVAEFAPGDVVQAKRRKKPAFRIVRKVGDTDMYEVAASDGVVGRHFYGTDLALVKSKESVTQAAAQALVAADLAKFDHDGNGKPGGSKKKK